MWWSSPDGRLGLIVDPGSDGVGHTWAYLPDLAETIARLGDIEEKLGAREVIHFRGHWLEDGREMTEAIRRAAGSPELPIRRFPWRAKTLAAPVVRLRAKVAEMRYLRQYPLALDNTKLVRLIGDEPHTPLDAAVATSWHHLGCLYRRAATPRRPLARRTT